MNDFITTLGFLAAIVISVVLSLASLWLLLDIIWTLRDKRRKKKLDRM